MAKNKAKLYVILKDDQLYAESDSQTGIPGIPIFAKSENEFFLKDFDVVFTFIKDENGKVFKLISHENGKDIVLKRIKQNT